MRLEDLGPKQKKKPRKRIGRGSGSGYGNKSGRGDKGQNARAGVSRVPGFEGGQTPLWKKIPKRGFNNPTSKKYCSVNVDKLEAAFSPGSEITPASLVENGIISGKSIGDGVKVLGRGEIKKSLTVKAHKFSRKAEEKIKQAGGEVVKLSK